jgi:pimeloyl-ACP methyl ester carboxylesterase
MVRALGAREAHLVGHYSGGFLARTVATLHQGIVQSLGIVGMPHPLRLREAMLRDPAQLRASSYMGKFQLPKAPEAQLLKDDSAYVERLLERWGGPGFPDAETAARCREAMQITGVAHSALEWYRWAFRSTIRPSGMRLASLLGRGVQAPVLQLHGAVDACTLPSTAHGSGAYAHGGYELQVLDDVGHFVHEEAPDAVTEALIAHARA